MPESRSGSQFVAVEGRNKAFLRRGTIVPRRRKTGRVIRLLLVLYDLTPPGSPDPAFIPLERLQQSAALAQTRRSAQP